MNQTDRKCQALLTWFSYRNSGPDVPDNDVSFAHVREYAALYGFPPETICLQKNSSSQYELRIPEEKGPVIFRGDTLTSVWTRLRGCLELAAEEGRFVWNRDLFGLTTGGRFQCPDFTEKMPGFACKGFQHYLIRLMGLDPALAGEVTELPEKRDTLMAAMAEALPDSFFDFLAVSRDSGNLILCPEDFNVPRGKGSLGPKLAGQQDTADHLAFCFARHFRSGGAGSAALEKLGPVDMDRLLEYFRILGIGSLPQCREKLFLQDLIDGDGRVLSFKTGKNIPEAWESYKPQPRSKEEYDLFFKNAAQFTQNRTARMTKALAAKKREDASLPFPSGLRLLPGRRQAMDLGE